MKKFIIIFSSIIAFGILANSIDTNNNSTTTQQNTAPQIINQKVDNFDKLQVDAKKETTETVEKTITKTETKSDVPEQKVNQKTETAQPLEKVEYYKNTAGNTVQSPTLYDSRPEGASARCGDGTYSFSQNRRGTCSRHGGVAEWY